MVGWSEDRGVRGLDSWVVGRTDGWKEGDTGAGTLRQSDGREVGEKVNLGQGQRVGQLDSWAVGRRDGWKESDAGVRTLGRSYGREVGEKVNLGQGQLDGREVGEVTLDTRWEVDNRKGRRESSGKLPRLSVPP